MTRRRIIYRPLDELVPATRNAKRHSIDGIAASIARFGIIDPIVEDGRTGQLISGHGRLETLRAGEEAGIPAPNGITLLRGRWYVPVVVGWSSTDDAEAEAALVAVNRLTEVGGWQPVELADTLATIATSPFGFDGTGYTPLDLDALLADLALPNHDETSPFNPNPTTDDYYTPAWVFEKMGLDFDLDVAPPPEPLPWIPVKKRFTQVDDGLAQKWRGRVWMNRPYSNPGPWMERFRHHRNGVALVPCSKGRWFNDAWADESLSFCMAPSSMKFIGGGIAYHTTFVAAGEANVAGIRRLGHVR